MANHTNPSSRRSAFTLVELLVVIGIIAVLVGILLPALGRARAQANTVACLANLRSIGQSIQIYAVQSKGTLPPGWFDGCVGGVTDPNSAAATAKAAKWPSILMAALSSKFGSTYNESKASGSETSKMREMFFCPEVAGVRMENTNGNSHYACHPRLMPTVGDDGMGKLPLTGGFGGVKPALPYKISKIKRASEIALIFDTSLQFDSANNAFRPAYDIPSGDCIDGYNLRSGTGTWLFFDRLSMVSPPQSGDDSISMVATPPNAQGKVNIDGSLGGSAYENQQNIRFRHNRDTVANVLMVDGHAESFTYNKNLLPTDKRVTTLKKRNVHVNFP